jgi:flagellar hook-basal body complex protein FliE
MSINAINPNMLQGFEAIKPVAAGPAEKGVGQANGESFGEMLNGAVKELDSMHKDADKQIEGLVLGKEGVTPHGAMIALEKADMAFQLMNNIRSKIIRAYEEVMRTQV